MAIPDEDVAQVRAATDMVALVGEHTALKRVGRRFVGLCPFHSEKSASFSVNAEEGLYHCFGCQASGDAISFVRAVEGCDFVEAVERLAARAGVTVRNEDDARSGANRGQRARLYDALSAAVAFYHGRLLDGRDAGPARQYLRSRGYDGDVVRQFQLGYAPAGYDDLVRSVAMPAAVLAEAGLAWEGRGRRQDAFRDRVIFPIFDPGGRAIALGGRVLPAELRSGDRDPGPKYRNSPESPIYQKRRTLYGLNWAKGDMARTGEAVVCEGYTDVVGFFRAGVPRAVATCGTSLTEDHFRLLANFARRIVLAFDSDSAGQNAAARLYEWERRHAVELAVATLPAGSDPAELAGSDPAALSSAVAAARPFLAFAVERALGGADLSTPEGRSRAAEAALAVVAEHPNDLVRDEYLGEVAYRTRLDTERLRSVLDESRRRSLAGAAAGSARPAGRGRVGATVRPAPTRPGSGPGSPPAPDTALRSQGGRGDHSRPPLPPGPPGGPRPRDDVPRDDVPRDGRGAEQWPAYDEPGDATPDSPHGEGARQGARGAGRSTGAPDRARAGAGRGAAERRPPRAGLDALALAIHRPADVVELFEEVLFADPAQLEAFRCLAGAADLHGAIASASPEVADLLRQLAVADLEPDLDPGETFVRLVHPAAQLELAALEREVRDAARSGDVEREREAAATAGAVRAELELIIDSGEHPDAARAALDAARGLVAWIAERRENGG